MSLISVKQSLISNSQSLIPESDIFFRKNLGARGALGALGAAGALVFFRLMQPQYDASHTKEAMITVLKS